MIEGPQGEAAPPSVVVVGGLTRWHRPLLRAAMRAFVPRDISKYPNILAYLKRIGERPGYRRAMEKGDPQMTPMLR